MLVHGALADRRMWEEVAAHLADRFEVWSVTQRHFHGGEPAAGAPFGCQAHAEDLVAFLERDVGRPAFVAGWSYGADVTLLAALLRPGAFRGALVYELGRHTHLAGEDLAAYVADASAMFGGLAQVLADEGPQRCAEELADAVAGEKGWFARQTPRARAIQLENAFTLPLQLRQAPSRTLTPTDIASIAVPVCYARGERTRPLFRIATDAAFRCARGGATHRVVAGATHMLPVEEPRKFADVVGEAVRARAEA